MHRTTSMLNSLSSTTNMFAFTFSAAASEPRSACCPAASRTNASTSSLVGRLTITVKKNLVPLPYTDDTWIWPRINSTSCLQIAKPNPTPKGFCTRLSRIFEKRPKSFCVSSARIPIPVSSTAKWRRRCEANSCCTAAETVIFPCGVNLTALKSRLSSTCGGRRSGVGGGVWGNAVKSRLSSTCRSRCWSPTTYPGRSSSNSTSMEMFLLTAFTLTISTAAWSTSWRFSTRCSSSSLPASIFEMSRMSLTRFIRCCADIIAFWEYLWWWRWRVEVVVVVVVVEVVVEVVEVVEVVVVEVEVEVEVEVVEVVEREVEVVAVAALFECSS